LGRRYLGYLEGYFSDRASTGFWFTKSLWATTAAAKHSKLVFELMVLGKHFKIARKTLFLNTKTAKATVC
jgi:hypothetical protein